VGVTHVFSGHVAFPVDLMRPRKTAYVDEAYEVGPAGVYVLAAVVAPADATDLRRELRNALRQGRQPRPHFSKENHKRRIVLADAVAGLGLPATVVVESSAGRAVRARGRCLARLAWELGQETGVDAIVFESRGRPADQHDASILARTARQGPRLAATFVRATEDPILWLADIIAGAVFQEVARGNSAYRAAPGTVRLVTL
jgi:hypothetical protein